MKNYCGKDDCLMTCDDCQKRNGTSLGKELKVKTSEPKLTKEKVGLPTKLKLPKGEKTGIISIFTGIPRRDRRVKKRDRVRERSPETFHPAFKKERAEKYYALRQLNMLKSARKGI